MNCKMKKNPSIEKPWAQYYSFSLDEMKVPECTLYQYLFNNCKNKESIALHYYGNDMTYSQLFSLVDKAAKALLQLGVKENEQVPVFLQSVPEYIILLLGLEKIGACILCRDGNLEENVDAIKKANSNIVFTHDFLSVEEEMAIYSETNVKHIIKISPTYFATKDGLRPHIKKNINSLYKNRMNYINDMMWHEFIDLSKNYTKELPTYKNYHSPLLRAYTTGTTGEPKQVIHSAYSIIGILCQIGMYVPSDENHRITWMHTIQPPSLVAVVITMILSPLSSNKLLILNPFCTPDTIDLEVMHFKPNCWALIPAFVSILVNSKRIPDDYDLSFAYGFGAGAEPINNKELRDITNWMCKHNNNIPFTVGYGLSEAGSCCTMPCPKLTSVENCCYGIPLPLTTIGIFEPNTDKELDYYELGEICKTGAGNMIGYEDKEETKLVLREHSDGKIWLHTKDIGYLTPDGLLYVLNRGFTKHQNGENLFVLEMENKIVDVKGIKDAFFIVVPNKENKEFYLPYLYIVLEKGYSLKDIENEIRSCLLPHEQPIEIHIIEKRPYFHFKTARKILVNEILNRK